MNDCGKITKPYTRLYNTLYLNGFIENPPREIKDDMVLYHKNFITNTRIPTLMDDGNGKPIMQNGWPISRQRYFNNLFLETIAKEYGMNFEPDTKVFTTEYPKDDLPYIKINMELIEKLERFGYEYRQNLIPPTEEGRDAVEPDDFTVEESPNLSINTQESTFRLAFLQDPALYQQELMEDSPLKMIPYEAWLAQKIQDKLQSLYPEIKLNITNNPVWEKGKDILNQTIENEMGEEYWKDLYSNRKLSNREEFESVRIPTIKNKYKPDYENVYHGTNNYHLDSDGNLILTPSHNFENKTESVSLTQIPVVAQDYMLRKQGNIIIKINNDALPSNYSVESAEEIAINGNKPFVVKKGMFEIIKVQTLAEKMKVKYANEVEQRAEELKDNAKSDLHLIDAIYSERIAADNYSELQEYRDVDISEQAPEWYVPDEYLNSRAAKKVYEDIQNKINKRWVIDTLSNVLIEQIKNTGEYVVGIETVLNNISTYGGRYAPHQSTLFQELLNEIGLGYSQTSTFLKQGEKLEKAKQKQKEYNELLDAIESLVEKEAEKSVKYYNSPEQVKLREEQKERDRINRETIQNLTGLEDIDDLPFQKIGDKIIGQANIKAMTVLIDAVNQKQDTLPHEYAHHYIAWFRNTPLVQEAIKKWGSEEALVQSIGEQVVKQKGEAFDWWEKFTKFVMDLFNNLSTKDKQELTNILTDAFLQGVDLETSKIGISRERSLELARKTSGLFNQEIKREQYFRDFYSNNQNIDEDTARDFFDNCML